MTRAVPYRWGAARALVLSAALGLSLVGCAKSAGGPASSGSQTAVRTGGPVEPRVDEAARLLAEARSEGDLRKALQILEGVVADAPGHAAARFDLGIARQRLGDLDGAERAYREAARLDPQLRRVHLHLGELERARGRVDRALAAFDEGLEHDPEDMDLHLARVVTLREAGRAQEAVDAAKAALAVRSDNVDIYSAMGLAWLDLGEPVLARFVFQKARMLPAGERDALIHANLGWTYYLEGQRALARYRLEEALALDPTLVPTLVYLARVYMDDHDWTHAVRVLEEAVRQVPGDAALRLNLGICYRNVGRHQEAKVAYERALALDPSDPKPLFDLGILLGDSLKDYEGAVGAFQRYIDAGGPEAELAREYVQAVERERTRVEKQREAEQERLRRQKEREQRQELLEQADDAAGEGTGQGAQGSGSGDAGSVEAPPRGAEE